MGPLFQGGDGQNLLGNMENNRPGIIYTDLEFFMQYTKTCKNRSVAIFHCTEPITITLYLLGMNETLLKGLCVHNNIIIVCSPTFVVP